MSVNELQALTQKFAAAFDQRDLRPGGPLRRREQSALHAKVR
jgi:hypothetical protein